MNTKVCPACAARMIDGPDCPEAWACTACGGVWAGTGPANRVLSVLDPAVRELAHAAERNAATTRERPPQARARCCPDCRAPLAVRELAGIGVDVCPEHGTWFDRGELQRVADRRAGKNAAANDHAPNSAKWKPDVATNVAADVAVGALGLFFSVLGDLGD